jgi:hypothetical protein
VATERRRARGWHRRDETRPRGLRRREARRIRLYLAAAIDFVAAAVAALMLPR